MLEDVKNYFANFDGTTNTCRSIALWVTVALVLAFVVTKLYMFVVGKTSDKYDGDALENAGRIVNMAWLAVALTVAVAFIITFSACYFVEVAHGKDDLVPILFYPILVFIIAVVGSGIALFIKPVKLTKIISAAVIGSAFIAAVVCMIVYYASGEAGEAFSNVGLYVSAILLAVVIVGFAFVADRQGKPFDTRAVTFAAICVAMSFALSYVRIFKMPMGGSITFASMLPLMIFAFMFGSRKGIMAGLVYGALQAIQDPWIIHPAQFLLDYILAFMSIGLAGVLRDLKLFDGKMRTQFIVGALIACAFRFISHYFAGVFAFGAYGEYYAVEYNMPALANAYLYSLVYQSLYIIPDMAIVLAVAAILLSSKNFRKQIEIYSGAPRAAKIKDSQEEVTNNN
ncbi:MAG: energy-coupled thiamine transporter ThiT [Clostridiales bacterium]|nr:energy-coupled thiamine transporter ThiT [Clostridiales bacterium]